MQPKNIFITVTVIIIATAITAGALWYLNSHQDALVTNFEGCAKAGYPIMESYPPQCRTSDGRTFTQDVGNELEKNDHIHISSPRPNTTVSGPLTITGEARGLWFFEASFPIHLEDASGNNIATTIAQAKGEWMTAEFVPFQTILDIPTTFSGKATLVLQKDNPSDLPENDDELRIPLTVISKNTP